MNLLVEYVCCWVCADGDRDAGTVESSVVNEPSISTTTDALARVRAAASLVQPGDLQLHLSLAFQKAAAEGSVLVLCTSPAAAPEIAATLGLSDNISSLDPLIAGHWTVSEAALRGQQLAFPLHSYGNNATVVISPASLARKAANAYLPLASFVRRGNRRREALVTDCLP